MDLSTAALIGAGMLGALIVLLRATNVWAAHSEELLAIKRANAERMANLDMKNSKKNPKKKSKNEEDDGEEPWEPLIEQMRPFQSAIKGFAASKGWPVDVDKIFEYDEAELDKLDNLAPMIMKGGKPQQANGITYATGTMPEEWTKLLGGKT